MSLEPSPRRVILERDETGEWIVSVPSIPGCHTYGRSISQATNRIPEVLLLWDADPHHIELEVRVEPRLRKPVAAAKRARIRADLTEERAREATTAAAHELTAAGYSRRDAGTLLGISHQRVQQLLDGS
jgi:predicted RNase H-like HicB family nuclease